ncbi:MAG: prepilin-type N-terminal cleavage/methylation domain-containing protein [Pseudomonadota bacterium]
MNIKQWKNNKGFTLLEIMVSVAILAVSLTAILRFHGDTLMTSARAEKMTIAAMLAQAKMTELEVAIDKDLKKGEFPEEKKEEDTFDAPYEEYKWRMTIKRVTLPSPIQGEEGSPQSMIGRQLTEQIAQMVREVKLEIIWDELGEEQSIDVITHIVNL